MDEGHKEIRERQRMWMPDFFGNVHRLERDVARPLAVAHHQERPGAETPTGRTSIMTKQFDLHEWIAGVRNCHRGGEVGDCRGRLATIEGCHLGSPSCLNAFVDSEAALSEVHQVVGDSLRSRQSRSDQLARPQPAASLKPLPRVTDAIGQFAGALITAVRSGGCMAACGGQQNALGKTETQFFLVSRGNIANRREQCQRAIQLNCGFWRRMPAHRLDRRRSVIGHRLVGASAEIEVIGELPIDGEHGGAVPLERLRHIHVQDATTTGG